MNALKYLSILLTASSLCGCGIYSNYKQPESLPIDSLFSKSATLIADSAEAADTASLASISWRELFSDSCLVQYIELGLKQNTDLQTARLRTLEAEASLNAAKLAFLPSLAFTPSGQISGVEGGAASKSYNIGFAADWEIDAFGSLRNAKRSSQAALEAQQAYELAVQTQLIASIADSYYSLIATDRKLQLTRETVIAWNENLRTMQALKRAGQKNEAAVAQAEANLLEAEASVISLERQANQLENALSTLLGLVPQKMNRSELFHLNFSSTLSLGVPALLLSRRPDLRQADRNLAEAFYATNKARSAFYPQITLSGSAGWTNSTGATISDPGKWLYSAVASLTQPIFSRGKLKANLKIAEARQQEAQLAFSQKLLDAGEEVNNALVQWQSAQKLLKIDRKRISALSSAVTSTQKMMQHGTASYLEVLTAQQSLLQAQIAEVSDKYSEIQGVINLYHALGGGTD